MIISIGILFRSRKAQSEDRRCTSLGANVAKLVLRFGPRLRLAACCFGTSAMNLHHRLSLPVGLLIQDAKVSKHQRRFRHRISDSR